MIPNSATLCHKEQGHKEQGHEGHEHWILENHGQEHQSAPRWQQALARAIRDPQELLAELGLSANQFPQGIVSQPDFPLRVPRGYAARMRHADPYDPLLLQVLSQKTETAASPGYVADPVGDSAATVSPGLLHKYQGRVLLVTTGACPVHCRYCFRRHYPYSDNHLDDQAWQQAIDYIAADTSIHEVILSGGDPLSLSNRRLAAISQQLASITHLKRLRIHSRMPVVLPERIDEGLLHWLTNLPWQLVMVIHCNHANEINEPVKQSMALLKQAGVTLLNQAVLLKNINDSLATQVALSEVLFEAGVLPYYLHLLDPVDGAAHFEVSNITARELMEALRRQLPGYLVPRLVRETPGMPNKTPLFPYS